MQKHREHSYSLCCKKILYENTCSSNKKPNIVGFIKLPHLYFCIIQKLKKKFNITNLYIPWQCQAAAIRYIYIYRVTKSVTVRK